MNYSITSFLLLLLRVLGSKGVYKFDLSSGVGRKFDGIGGLSGGSATSKLLINYPDVERNAILDYLFKPNFGASLQILKVEIGGDTQASDGTESSHMHESWDENYQRGYEWWLMTEAKKRNPDIKLYGLPWGFPGWLGNGSGDPYKYPSVTANYILKWILAAKKFYQLDIDYIGIWNERKYDITYVETLKRVLKGNNLTANVQMVVGDGDWGPADDIPKYPAFAEAVDIIGCHYPGTTATNASISSGKRLWASEDYSTFNDNVGAGCWARILNQNYVNGFMTSTISWNLIASYYDALPFWTRQGLMTANEPWSGHYIVANPIWITAHTTQFAQIGWNYLQHGSGVQLLDYGGSFVTLISPDRKDLTIVIETMSHDHSICIRPDLPPYNVLPQEAEFFLGGILGEIEQLFVWKTHLGFNGETSTVFRQQDPIEPFLGTFSLILYPDEVYTLTTIASGQHGVHSSPPNSKPFPLPYSDNFEDYAEYTEAFDWAPQSGVWEVRQSNNPSYGKVNRQVVLHDPIYWCNNNGPEALNLGGDYSWSNIRVSSDIFVPSTNGTSGVFVAVRVDRGGCDSHSATGIFLTVFPGNATNNGIYKVSSDLAMSKPLGTGTCSVKYDTWFTLSLYVKDEKMSGFVGKQLLFTQSIPSTARKSGFAAYGTATYGYADYDNWSIGSTEFVHDRL